MSKLQKFTALLSVFLFTCACTTLESVTFAQAKSLTVDDVMKIEGIGDARFSPDGSWLAYNLIPPYDRLHDYSYWLYAYSLSGHQLWVKNLSEGVAPYLQPGLDQTASNYLVDFSPAGDHVIVLQHKLGELRFVSCKVGLDQCVKFDYLPDIRDGDFIGAWWNERIVWTSPQTFIMPTRGRNLPGSTQYSRGIAGKFLWRQWNNAWRGDVATASEVVSTKRDRSKDWASGELMEFDVEGGAARTIAKGRFAGVRVSPDQRYIAAGQVGERSRPPPDVEITRPATHPLFDRRYALRIIDTETGQIASTSSPYNVDPNSFAWSADGQSVAVFGWEKNETSHDGKFYIVDAMSLDVQLLRTQNFVLAKNHTRSWESEMDWAPGPGRIALLDRGIVAFGRRKDASNDDWYLFDRNGISATNLTQGLKNVAPWLLYADAKSTSITSASGPYRVDADGRRTPVIAHRAGNSIHPLFFSANSQHSWSPEFRFNSPRLRPAFSTHGVFVVQDDCSRSDSEIRFVDFTAPDFDVSILKMDILGADTIAASQNAGSAVVSVKDGAATRLLLVDEEGASTQLDEINTHLNTVDHAKKQEIDYLLRDPRGVEPPRPITGCLLLPPDYSSEQRYPLVVNVYPIGTSGSCATLADSARPSAFPSDLWPARGFIYFRPAIPLDFARMGPDRPIAGMDDIVDQSIDAVVNQGFADPSRIVLFGFSQGGVSSLYVATQSDKIAAVISVNGWADFFSHYFGAKGITRYFHLDQNGGDNRWRYECVGQGIDNSCPFGFGATPFDASDTYISSSPVTLAEGITAPVLLVNSDLDYFDMAQYDEMFGALYRAGKEARYVRYWGEGHGPSSPANIRDMWLRIDDFLSDHGGAP